eukprot:TCONS_00025503-protein
MACIVENDLKKEPIFIGLCDNILSSVSVHFDSINGVLNLNDMLMKYGIPTSVQLQLSLKCSLLQRTFMYHRSLIEELVRLTKLYSTSWEEKNHCLKELHRQYNTKQRKLDIALKKIEMLSGRSKALERMRINHNWEKMFLKVSQNQCGGLGWRQAINDYKECLSKGEGVSHFFNNLEVSKDESPEKYVVDVEKINNEIDETYFDDDSNLDYHSMGENESFIDNFSSESEEELKFSGKQNSSFDLTHHSSVHQWISDSTQDHSAGTSIPQKQPKPETKECGLQTEKKELSDHSTMTRTITYKNIFNIFIEAPTNLLELYPGMACTVAFNSMLEKVPLLAETKKACFQYEKQLTFDKDFVLHCKELEGTLKLGFHADEKKPMVAFLSTSLSDLKISVNSDEMSLIHENEIEVLSCIDKGNFRFNKPCGSVKIFCNVSQTVIPFQQDKSIETISLKDFVENIINTQRRAQLERCRSACVETDEKPVYTEVHLESVRGELTQQLQDLKTNYEEQINTVLLSHSDALETKDFASMATSPIMMGPYDDLNFEEPSFIVDQNLISANQIPRSSGKKSKFSQRWDKNLPPNFLKRVGQYQEASLQYHQELKTKTHEQVEKEYKKKLGAEKKLSRIHTQPDLISVDSVYAKDLYLPAVFMPFKTKRGQPVSGRSFLSHPIQKLQLPLLDEDLIDREQQPKDVNVSQ